MAIYQTVTDSPGDASIRLRASIALADLYLADQQGRRALAVLDAAVPLADTLPEWKPHLEQRLEAAKALVPAVVRQLP
jgi:hypothetical protein